jgi:hypothetical protein
MDTQYLNLFQNKDVMLLADKTKILGNLIAKTNTQYFYANKAALGRVQDLPV